MFSYYVSCVFLSEAGYRDDRRQLGFGHLHIQQVGEKKTVTIPAEARISAVYFFYFETCLNESAAANNTLVRINKMQILFHCTL